ncbi:MAG: GNAT family N-acetyltransferase [Micromonosporaceae bacterium]
MTDIQIRATRYGAPAARTLIGAAQADIAERYGGESDESPLEAIEFDPPEGCFMVAWLDGEPVACGGWRRHGHLAEDAGPDAVAEIKRMFTLPKARSRGVATALLRALEDSAREAGMARMVLETGLRHPEAMAFYARSGYQRIENYGFYRDEPDCVLFGRDL